MKNYLFSHRKYISLSPRPAKSVSDAEASLCPVCTSSADPNKLGDLKVCPRCGYHFHLDSRSRLETLVDPESWEEFGTQLTSANWLEFPGYEEKLSRARRDTGLDEAVITGTAKISGYRVVLAVMEYGFMGGSMGAVVGEKVVQAVEKALQEKMPLIIFTASGGARMQEGMAALTQMARTAAAIQRLHEQKILYCCVMTHPTTGGVSASFAALADIIVAEPGALIGFTGPRVVQQTLKQPLPDGFQKAEYLLEHGMIDDVIPRTRLRAYLSKILDLHVKKPNGGSND